MKPQILVVDDIPAFVEEVTGVLALAGMRAQPCLSPAKAARLTTRGTFDLILTTLVMKEMGGFDLIRKVRGEGVRTPFMMITGYGSPAAAIEATRLGVSDYMTKPVAPEELIARVRQILEHSATEAAGTATFRMEDMVTKDLAMKAIFEMVETIAPSRSRVLILGETGTGKQLLARAIHAHSDRADQPFVEVNCAAIPESLLESELFGHERGSFTGATSRRIGRFEQAGKGTIFLDEIGEMSLALQSKLLHVLEDGRFQRVGGSTTLRSGARVITATNRDLKQAAEAGAFRSDLYYRLNVIAIQLPSLRERREDIPLLAQHFLERFSEPGRPAKRFLPEVLELLAKYDWPGNVRELQNLVERIAVLNDGPEIAIAALPGRLLENRAVRAIAAAAPPTGPYRQVKAEFERAYLRAMLDAAGGNLAKAARAAELDRAQFYRLAKRHGLAGHASQAAAV